MCLRDYAVAGPTNHAGGLATLVEPALAHHRAAVFAGSFCNSASVQGVARSRVAART
jgi:hypothetical protein